MDVKVLRAAVSAVNASPSDPEADRVWLQTVLDATKPRLSDLPQSLDARETATICKTEASRRAVFSPAKSERPSEAAAWASVEAVAAIVARQAAVASGRAARSAAAGANA